MSQGAWYNCAACEQDSLYVPRDGILPDTTPCAFCAGDSVKVTDNKRAAKTVAATGAYMRQGDGE